MNIAFIGFRGTGKTTIGQRVAKRLNMKFTDIDKEIVKTAGKSVPEIFAQSGEEGFRILERKAVADISSQDNMCIACGGGVVLFKENIDNLKRNSTIILLEAQARVIYRRIRNDSNRPSLTGKEKMDEIIQLLGEREPLYEAAAEMKFDTSQDSVPQTVQKIIDELNERGKI